MPLALQYPDGQGLRLGGGAPVPAFVRAVLGQQRLVLAAAAVAADHRRRLGGTAIPVRRSAQRG